MKNKINYIKKNFDSIAILTVLTNVTLNNISEPTIEDNLVIEAFRRYKKEFQNFSLEDIGNYLSEMNHNQLQGVINNVKGILHEMEYVKLENEDGDIINAALFQNTNNPGYDVIMFDNNSGNSWNLQLKATDNSSYVRDWIESHPDGEIKITEELANKMNLPSSGLSNESLEVRVEDVVDQLSDIGNNDSIWNYFPQLSVISISIIIYELYKRYRSNLITYNEFKQMSIRVTGYKITKIGVIILLLSIPGVNIVTGSILIFNLLNKGQNIFK